jgi:hypothetical protein
VTYEGGCRQAASSFFPSILRNVSQSASMLSRLLPRRSDRTSTRSAPECAEREFGERLNDG